MKTWIGFIAAALLSSASPALAQLQKITLVGLTGKRAQPFFDAQIRQIFANQLRIAAHVHILIICAPCPLRHRQVILWNQVHQRFTLVTVQNPLSSLTIEGVGVRF